MYRGSQKAVVDLSQRQAENSSLPPMNKTVARR
jgi:hypothetical protein